MNLYIILALVLVSILVAIIIVKVIHKSPNTSETYSASDGNIMISDSNGNLSLTPNILNDLQTKVQAQSQATDIATQITGLTTQITGLTTQLNNIINGTTHISNLNVDGVLTVNSGDYRPIRMNKLAGTDKTILISYQFGGNEFNANGLDGDGNLWGSNGVTTIPKGWFNAIS
jgi:hypothetical protein